MTVNKQGKIRPRLGKYPNGHTKETAHADSRKKESRHQIDEMLDRVEECLAEQKDNVPSVAQSSITAHQAKRGKILFNEAFDWFDWAYEVNLERSYSHVKKIAGRKSGHDVGDQ